MARKDKSVYICTAWETDLNKWVFQPDSILIPVEFQRNSYGFHWNSTGMTGFQQDSTGIPVDSTGIPLEWPDSCRNRWGTVKYWEMWGYQVCQDMLTGFKFNSRGHPWAHKGQGSRTKLIWEALSNWENNSKRVAELTKAKRGHALVHIHVHNTVIAN